MPPKSKTPKRRQCGTMIVHQRLLERDSGYRARLMSLENATNRRMSAKLAPPRTRTIQVVVHVVYNKAAENIGAAQIDSQIRALNRDFAATNPDKSSVPAVWKGLVGDARIQFKLAARGITRTKTTRTSFSDDDSVKSTATGGQNPWNTRKYLNIWVCTLADSLLGYAQFPSGPAATDGVVILNTAFGSTGTAAAPFNLGRTATHEVGHYFNLHHIWGDVGISCADSDYVADTPNQEGPNQGKPSFPTVSCQNGPNGDMYMNYMDYVNDDTMVMFTAQQRIRMQATLAGPRSGL
ncbi:MAG TPA: zinc metalloprotease [Myxococcota bacterium]|jgi:hypothetical protein